MPVTRRSRTVAAPQERVWSVVGDPSHLPRWWPGVRRVEGLDAGRFTKVMVTRRGRPVRMDFRLVESAPPSRARWEQEIAGSPFERLVSAAEEEVALAPAAGGTEVTLTLSRRLRGWSRFGGFLFRRAGARELDEALDGLEGVVGG